LPTIRRAAEQKLMAEPDRLRECLEMIEAFQVTNLYPLLYVIEWERVRDRVVRPAWRTRGNLWSAEFIIGDLAPDEFEVLSFKPVIL
jgi:hypothetical protein